MWTIVNVFAMEYTRTYRDQVSRQGFGSSSPLVEPEATVTSYHWSATWPKDVHAATGASNDSGDLRRLAENFAINYPRFPRSEREPVQISTEPTDEAKDYASRVAEGTGEVRPLTLDELTGFLVAFQEARERTAVTT